MMTNLEARLIVALKIIDERGRIDLRDEGEVYPEIDNWVGNYDDCFRAGETWGVFQSGEIARKALEGVSSELRVTE